MITRRFFIAGAMSFGAFHGLRAFSAPSNLGLRHRGNLRFGVISDIHVALSLKDGVTPNGMPRIVEEAFKYFRDEGVDAVVYGALWQILEKPKCGGIRIGRIVQDLLPLDFIEKYEKGTEIRTKKYLDAGGIKVPCGLSGSVVL